MLNQFRLLAVAVLCVLMLSACGKKPRLVEAYSPEEKADRLARAEQIGGHYLKRMTLFVDDNAAQKTGGTVFLGDSITEGFPVKDAFPNDNVVNRGIGGDKVSGVLARLDTSVEDLEPKRVYLMIGINDLTWGKVEVDTLKQQYEELIENIKIASPGVDLVVLSTLPTRGKYEEVIPKVAELNDTVEQLAKKHGVEFIHLWPAMADENNRLRAEYTNDGVHLTLAGYMRWLEQIVHDEDEYIEVVRNMSTRWAKDNPIAWQLKAIDPSTEGALYAGNRGPNEMLVYTPKYGATTGTNEWGAEAIVVNNVVTEKTIGNTAIPPDGYVVSGHGSAATWINVNLAPGTPVELKDNTIALLNPPKQQMNEWVEFWHAAAALHVAGAGDAEWRQAKKIVKKLRANDATAMSDIRKLNPARYEAK